MMLEVMIGTAWEQRWYWLERETRGKTSGIGMFHILIRVIGHTMLTKVKIHTLQILCLLCKVHTF